MLEMSISLFKYYRIYLRKVKYYAFHFFFCLFFILVYYLCLQTSGEDSALLFLALRTVTQIFEDRSWLISARRRGNLNVYWLYVI